MIVAPTSNFKVLLLAGGAGSRLWPLSTKECPKQFLRIDSDTSLLQQALLWAMKVAEPGLPYVITGSSYISQVRAHWEEIGKTSITQHIICEPCAKNTGPAIAYGLAKLYREGRCQLEDIVLVAPTDHYIVSVDRWYVALKEAGKLAQRGHTVLFGLKPCRIDSGFGYIIPHEKDPCEIKKFVEKPDVEIAKALIENENALWNIGVFCFKLKTFIDALAHFAPQLAQFFSLTESEANQLLQEIQPISIDCALMEHPVSKRVIPLEMEWSDMGSWDNIYQILSKDESGNMIIGNVVESHTCHSLIFGGKRLIVAHGLQDLVIVDTQDALLITRLGQGQALHKIMGQINEKQNINLAGVVSTESS